VGVHADDERVGMRDDGHGGRASFRRREELAADAADAGLEGSHFGTAL
jgi:hypothetical protein